MKATELMIGDWVMNPNDGRTYKIHTITAVEQTRLSNPYNLTDLEYGLGEPIPITAEILEKNGFRIGHHGTYNIWGFHIGNHYDGYFTPYIDVGYATRDLTYVHELQHALRLCGLNELADNFKI